ncbi:MAG TPA: hypothetical protein VMU50_07850 [Polyangia bacterium]|nr:hypothetical protein [Polyangia bacterium]
MSSRDNAPEHDEHRRSLLKLSSAPGARLTERAARTNAGRTPKCFAPPPVTSARVSSYEL